MNPKTKTETSNVTCSNPKCRRTFASPMIVQNLGSEGVTSYCVCPYCLVEIKETLDDEGRKRQNESNTIELQQFETLPIEKKPILKPSEKNRCSKYFGYLSQFSGGKETPDEYMICEKLIECKLRKPDLTPPRIAPKTVAIEEANQSVELVEDSTLDIAKKELEEIREPETENEPLPMESSGNQLVVENLGMLYTSWSGTVCSNSETLLGLGGKNKGGEIGVVDIQTNAGKKMRYKVMPSKDPRKGTMLIPDKIQLNLEIKKGDLVRVEPIIVFDKEDKIKDIVHALSTFLKR